MAVSKGAVSASGKFRGAKDVGAAERGATVLVYAAMVVDTCGAVADVRGVLGDVASDVAREGSVAREGGVAREMGGATSLGRLVARTGGVAREIGGAAALGKLVAREGGVTREYGVALEMGGATVLGRTAGREKGCAARDVMREEGCV